MMFFALSGYLIGKIVFSQSDAPNFLGVFYRRRALRILPLFGVMLALSLAGRGVRRTGGIPANPRPSRNPIEAPCVGGYTGDGFFPLSPLTLRIRR